MKHLIALLALVVLFTVTSCGGGFDADAEQEKLESILEQLTTATGDTMIEVMDKYVDNDFEWYLGFGLGNPAVNPNWVEIGNRGMWFLHSWSQTQTTDSTEWMIAPDLAVVKAKGTWIPHGEQGFDHLTTGVFEKRDGQWYLVHMHSAFMKCPIDC